MQLGLTHSWAETPEQGLFQNITTLRATVSGWALPVLVNQKVLSSLKNKDQGFIEKKNMILIELQIFHVGK